MPNQLAHEKSPYLLQHADNPVNWHPWGDEALALARDQDKPIFLSIGYATCHWCHVMAHESFEDNEVADLLNEHFVAIKVDREERPDLDDVYMSVCQALTGAGGWPLSVFLTPEAKPFYAGTYFPKTGGYGRPGFIQVLTELAKRWQSDERERMVDAAEEITKAIAPQASFLEPSPEVRDQAYSQLSSIFDAKHGGFGKAPKFPTPHQLNFLLRYHQAKPDSSALAMVETTLSAMRGGGIFDQVGFGFHRYSVDEHWLAPHFEKMLYDQAMLAMAYLEAFQVTGDERYASTAREVFEYVLRDMTHEQGGFYSAEDADSEGAEGLFYVWRPAQVIEALGQEAGELFNEFYDITEAGNFEHGLSIAHRTQSVSEFAAKIGRDSDEVADALEAARQKLHHVRGGRVRPLLDDKVLTAWNGLMIAALAMGYRVLGDEAYLTAAIRAADFVAAELSDDQGRLMRRWREGQIKGEGFLEDYAFMIWGLVELHQAGFDPMHLEQALRLSDLALELFSDPQGGGLFFVPAHGERLIVRNKDAYDGAIPSGNSVMAYNLLRLARLTGRSELESRVGDIFAGAGSGLQGSPSAFTMLLCALDLAYTAGNEIVLAGEVDDPEMAKMLAVVRERFAPGDVVLLRPGGKAGERVSELAAFTAEMTPPASGALAYVCQSQACQRPVSSAQELAAVLEQGS